MQFAVKAAIADPRLRTYILPRQKTMYSGKSISCGDIIFVFASELQGGKGLIARGVVIDATAVPKKPGLARQTPLVSITIRRTALAKRTLGRAELKDSLNWKSEDPRSELNFKFYRQATNKIVGISDKTASFLGKFF